jgi:hypothetical protein
MKELTICNLIVREWLYTRDIEMYKLILIEPAHHL